MSNRRTKNVFTTIVAGIFLLVAVMGVEDVFAGTTAQSYSGSYTKTSDAALVFYGAEVDKGDGFAGGIKYLTENQLRSITSETAADVYFPGTLNSYMPKTQYSGRRRNDEWYLKWGSGIDMKGAANSLGVDVSKNVTIYTGAKDGYSGSLEKAFTQTRYTFPTGTSLVGTAVDPVLALTDTDSSSETPKLMFGQTSAKGDYNMQNWAKYTNKISFGTKEKILKLSVAGGSSITWDMGQIAETKSGLYRGTYTYNSGSDTKTAQVIGVPLNKLLADKNVAAADIGSVTVTGNGGAKRSISASELSKYFLAFQGTVSVNGGSASKITGSGDLQLYGPGATEKDAVLTGAAGMTASMAKPGKVTVKASRAGYNSIKLKWNKAAGASGYYIYRYDLANKKYKEIYDVTSGSKTTYTNKKLVTNRKYIYKVRAYKLVGALEVLGDSSGTGSARPTLNKGSIKSITKVKSSNGAKIKWKKVAGASGYQIYRSTKKSGKYKKAATVKKGSQIIYTNKKLKKKTYYYKVRAYRNISGKKTFGAFSKVKKIRIK